MTLSLGALLSIILASASALSSENSSKGVTTTRRQALRASSSSCSFLLSSLLLLPSQPANAARGAAELDLEFYARALFGGNRKEGNIEATKFELPPPRTLQGPLLPLLLSNDGSSLPIVALGDLLQKRTSGKDEVIIKKEILSMMNDVREKSKRSFAARAPWREESLSDQYYFDLTSYSLWRVAAQLIPDYRERDAFVRQLGRLLYAETSKLVPTPTRASSTLSSTLPMAKAILDLFQSSGFCKGYRIGEKPSSKNEEAYPVLDELDDDAIATGSTVDCLISIFEPATLGASLQITGEQSRFSPDYIGPTLAALWETVGVRSSWETFFVDNEYRPNPKDYFPNEQLYQFTLSAAK